LSNLVTINKSTLTLLYQGGNLSPLIKGDEEGFDKKLKMKNPTILLMGYVL